MFPLIETAAAFAAVMLVTSLFVSAVVQVIQGALGLRPKILGGMLTTVARGYREGAGLSKLASSEEEHFVRAILGHHLLHSAHAVDAAKDDAGALAAKIDYLHRDDLLDIVHRHFAPGHEGGSPQNAGPAGGTEKGPVRDVIADVDQFRAFVERWYETIGATASEHYKRRMRRITMIVSCLVVVLFNLDGIHLIGDLYRDQAARDALLKQVDTIHQTAVRLGEVEPAAAGTAAPPAAVHRDAGVKELRLELEKTAAILDEASVGIGWQTSWIVKRWCAYEGACARSAPRPTAARLAADVALWLAGLLFSCVMLSLGAPFWATTLGRLVNLRNAVQEWRGGGSAREASGKGGGKQDDA